MLYFLLSLIGLIIFSGCSGPALPTRQPAAPADPVAATVEALFPPDFDIQGHRGARGLKPENTLPAFETALDLGVTTLELDLHLTADDVVVVWHDPEIDSDKCGLKPAAGVDAPDPDSLIVQGRKLRVSNLTFEQLGAYQCDRNPDPALYPAQDSRPTELAGDDYGIVSLAELLDFVEAYAGSGDKSDVQRNNAHQVAFNLETKRRPDQPWAINDGFDGESPGPFELAIISLVEERNLVSRVIIQSFDHRSLWAIRSLNGAVRLAALTSGARPDFSGIAVQGATIWSPNYHDLSADRIEEAHESGLLVIPWTVNDLATMEELISESVDGLITDRPDILVKYK